MKVRVIFLSFVAAVAGLMTMGCESHQPDMWSVPVPPTTATHVVPVEPQQPSVIIKTQDILRISSPRSAPAEIVLGTHATVPK